eukprot:9609361-Prorocentrum_lima.AAC.1
MAASLAFCLILELVGKACCEVSVTARNGSLLCARSSSRASRCLVDSESLRGRLRCFSKASEPL